MATLTEATLDPDERRTLDRLVELLETEYGSDLHAVWLYGSRARGEYTGPESDIDIMAIVTGGADYARSHDVVHRAATDTDGDPWRFSLSLYDPVKLSRERGIESFYIAEVDRDKIVLFGDGDPSIAGLGGESEPLEPLHGQMSPRSEDFMAVARERLEFARLGLAAGTFSSAVEPIYYASLNAARAALSEEHGYARTHSGIWHLFHKTFVVTGRFDPAIYTAARNAQKPREDSTYAAVIFERDDVERMLADAERFIAAVEAMVL